MSMDVAGLTIEYRNPSMTIACVESLLLEGVAIVLIVDNSDDGGASASTLLNRFVNEPRVELLESDRNLGFAAGMNLGLAWLRQNRKPQRTLLVNNDATLEAGALLIMLDAFKQDPSVSLVYPTLLHAGKSIGLTYYHRAAGLLTQRHWPGSFPFVSGCCLLLAESLVASDLFDDTFFMYGEDVELSWRLAKAHIRTAAAPSALVTHVGSAASGMGSEFYETHMVAGHFILAKRLASGRLSTILLFGGRMMTLTLRAILRCIRFRSLTPLRALAAGALLGWRALHLPSAGFA